MNYALLILLLAVASSATAQNDPLPPPLHLHFGSHRIVIPQHDERGRHDWYADVCRGGIERTTLHALTHRGGTLYIVFGCAGWSRGQPDDRRRCGGGWEHQINWMVIRNGVVTAHQMNDIESCWRDTSGAIDGWKHGVLTWGSDGIDTGYSAFYDPKSPEKGLQLKETHKLP